MKKIANKIITKKTYSERVISEWVKPIGYDLSICTINTKAMEISFNLVYGTFAEFKTFLKKEYNHDIKFNGAHAIVVQFEYETVVWNFMLITQNTWTAQDYGTICHELHHLTHFALSDKGVSYGEAGEEVFAYTQGYFMELVVRAFVELHKIKTIK